MNPERLLQNFDRLIDTPDAVPRLRRFILDLAVRGKLVEQNPGDEPAGELLKRIEGEKQRLFKAGKNRKENSQQRIDDETFLFGLPDSWVWTSIRQIAIDRGQKVPNKEFTYIDVSAIDKEQGMIGQPQILTPDVAPSRARKLVQKGDVIYSCVRPYLLNIAIVDEEYKPAPIVSTAFAVLNGLGLVLPRYLWIVLRSPYFVTRVEEKMRGQAYPAINDGDFALLPVPLPPLPEQHRIVAKVDELMKLCDELEAAQAKRERRRDRLVAATLHGLNNGKVDNENGDNFSFEDSARFYFNHLTRLTTRTEHIQQLRQTILNLAVKGKLVEQNPEDEPVDKSIKKFADQKPSQKEINANDEVSNLGESYSVPNGWAWLKGYQIADFIDPQPSHRTPPVCPSGVAYIGYSDITSSGQIDFINARKVAPSVFVEHRQRYTLKKGDFIIGKIGTIGQPVLLTEPFDYTLSANIILVQPHAHLIEPSYLMTFISSPVAERVLREVKTNSTHAVFGIKKARELLIPVPPFAEQHRIVAKVAELMALCDGMEAWVTINATTKRKFLEATLQKAIAGQYALKQGGLQ